MFGPDVDNAFFGRRVGTYDSNNDDEAGDDETEDSKNSLRHSWPSGDRCGWFISYTRHTVI